MNLQITISRWGPGRDQDHRGPSSRPTRPHQCPRSPVGGWLQQHGVRLARTCQPLVPV